MKVELQIEVSIALSFNHADFEDEIEVAFADTGEKVPHKLS